MRCDYCGKEVEDGANFCSDCGEPLNDLAKKFKQKEQSVAQLKLINLLLDKVDDPKTLNLLQKLVERYKKDI